MKKMSGVPDFTQTFFDAAKYILKENLQAG